MQDGFLKLVAGALVIGALMIFAALQLIGPEANKGRLAQLADQPSAPEYVIEPDTAPMPEPIPEPVFEDEGWYDDDEAEQDFAPEPFDPAPQLDDLPLENLRFDPHPEPGVGQPQMVTPDDEIAMQAPPQ